MRPTLIPLFLLGLLVMGQAQAHEFWFKPIANPKPLHSAATLDLEVGEQFQGDLVGFSQAATVSLRHQTRQGTQSLTPLLPQRGAVGSIELRLDTPGTHMVSFESQTSSITLPAEKFHAYLHDEGLDAVKAQREASGTQALPGRERYRRCVKTLIAAGSATTKTADRSFSTPAGMRLEIVPLNNPLTLRPGAALALQVLFEQKPLAGALVKAFHTRGGETLTVRATTSDTGEVSIHLPYAGAWMVSVVHMVPAVGEADVDWDSFWGNLSFSLR